MSEEPSAPSFFPYDRRKPSDFPLLSFEETFPKPSDSEIEKLLGEFGIPADQVSAFKESVLLSQLPPFEPKAARKRLGKALCIATELQEVLNEQASLETVYGHARDRVAAEQHFRQLAAELARFRNHAETARAGLEGKRANKKTTQVALIISLQEFLASIGRPFHRESAVGGSTDFAIAAVKLLTGSVVGRDAVREAFRGNTSKIKVRRSIVAGLQGS